jgi:hypothetical protein
MHNQAIRVHSVELGAGRVVETHELTASIPDGEAVEFVTGGVVIFRAQIQFIPIGR